MKKTVLNDSQRNDVWDFINSCHRTADGSPVRYLRLDDDGEHAIIKGHIYTKAKWIDAEWGLDGWSLWTDDNHSLVSEK